MSGRQRTAFGGAPTLAERRDAFSAAAGALNE